jgi:NADH-quinone oxidoreductase subunit N
MSPTTYFLALGLPYIPGWGDLRPFVADLWLVAAIVGVLLTPFFVPRRANAACAAVALAGLALALVSLLIAGSGPADQPARFGPMLVSDPVAFLWKVLLLLFVMGIVLLWSSTTADTFHPGDGPEFFSLLLGATLGMSLMASAANLLMLFLAVELASLPSYVLAGFRKTNRIGAEASLKYVLFGAATSSVMAYGLSLLYGLCGTLQLYSSTAPDGMVTPGLAQVLAQGAGGGGASAVLLTVAFVGLIVGVGFKVSAVPFHFWCPDVFEGASIDVSAFLSVASKGAALVLLLRVLMAIAEAGGYAPAQTTVALAAVVGVIGAITATVGNTAAYVQTNIKRLLAYSSIAHAGYMLCALSLLVVGRRASADFRPAADASQAILLYLAVYLFMNLGAFTVAGVVWRATGSESLPAYRGLGSRAPVLAACMFLFLVSLIGLPPVAGFVAKLNLMWVLVKGGGWWWWLVAVIGVNTILSAFYYFRVIRAMYLEPAGDSDADEASRHAFDRARPLGTALAVACAAVLVVMFVGFSPLSNVTGRYGTLRAVNDATPRGAAPATRPVATPAPQNGQPPAELPSAAAR